MSDVASHLAFLRDPRLAVLATSAAPAWLWSTDATRIIWANPVGAAIFGLTSPAALAARRFDPREQTAAQIARLLGTLRLGGAARLERLRGFGTGFWRTLLCTCSRVSLADHTAGVLVVAMEPAGPALTLAERVRRLYDGSDLAFAAFTPDGNLIHATPEGRARIGAHATLAALGAERMGEDAIALGRAAGESPLGRLTIERLGADATTVLAATFAAERAAAAVQPRGATPPAPREPPPPAPVEPPPREVVAPPTVPASPAVPEAPPVAPEMPGPAVEPPPPAPVEPPPREVVAPPTVPASPAVPEAPPVAPEMPGPAAGQPPPATPDKSQDTDHDTDQDAAKSRAQQKEEKPMPPLRIDVPIPERRHPLRFVWQMDASGRFTLGSDEFAEVIGPRIAIALGRPWAEINDELALDPEGQVTRAVATRDTWSGITVSWPVDGSADRLKVELSGLPIYDRNRNFLGYRGFGVCRDIDRIATLAVMRRSSLVAAPATPPASVPAPAEAAPALAPDGSPEARPALTLVPTSANVVPFRSAAPAPEPKAPSLSPVERNAFHELARQLTARLKGDAEDDTQQRVTEPPADAAGRDTAVSVAAPATAAEATAAAAPAEVAPAEPAEAAQPPAPPAAETIAESLQAAAPAGEAAADAATAPAPAAYAEPERREPTERPLLDRIPVGVLVYRLDTLLYANRAFLEWTGYDHLDALADAGGLDSLFVEGGGADTDATGGAGRTLAIATPRGDKLPVEGRLFSIPWDGDSALVLMLVTTPVEDRLKATEASLQTTATVLETTASALQTAETALQGAEAQERELKAILDTATDGVVVIEPDGRIVSANRSAEALFGYEAAELTALSFAELFAPESRAAALDYLANLGRGGVAGLINDGRELMGQVRQGGSIALFMTLGRIADDSARVCAVFRDITPWKKAENDLIAARQEAERASDAKSEFLAKISHEIRTPLNSIVGFSEVMLEERFGPIGNERYRDYLKDIRSSGDHVVALLNDLLDLSKIEAGKLDLELASLNLNDLVQSCVTLMQPQANRERIIIRSSLSPTLRPVVADARSVRQIVLNLLSNSIKFTGAGGQVIVSTAQADDDEVVLRVRDTGIGMDDKELAVALEPFRQLATATRWGSAGTGLGLPLTRALVEANRARFTITSKVNDGTLVEVAFPATRVPAG